MANNQSENGATSRLPDIVAFLGGATAWGIQLAAGYLLVTLHDAFDIPAIRVWLVLLSLLMLLLTAGAGYLGWKIWQRSGIDGDTEAGGRSGTSGYLGLGGLLLSAVFAFAIILGGGASVFLSASSG